MTDLHIISWNRPEMTKLVIKTIHRNTDKGSFRLVVLDNASEPETVDMLQSMSDNGLIDEFISIKTNLGLEAARDLLLREATNSERFVCVDNDCLAPPRLDGEDWLTRMNRLMDENEGYGAISMRTQVMIGTGNIFENETDELTDFPHPGGSFRLMNTAVTRRLGGWDRQAPGRGSEERYICTKLWAEGYKCAFATNIECLHLFGDRQKTKERWGYSEDLSPEDTGHSDIYHPALEQGDDINEVIKYSGNKLAKGYFS